MERDGVFGGRVGVSDRKRWCVWWKKLVCLMERDGVFGGRDGVSDDGVSDRESWCAWWKEMVCLIEELLCLCLVEKAGVSDEESWFV